MCMPKADNNRYAGIVGKEDQPKWSVSSGNTIGGAAV